LQSRLPKATLSAGKKRTAPMEMTGEYRIPASRQRVWEALNDPDVLKQCIPGCQSLEKVSDTEFNGRVVASVGPVRATFGGKVTLSDLDPPQSYTITGEGSGGVAGFAKGGAKVNLAEEGAETLLTYDVQAQVGGKLAQIGSRLIDGVARKMATDFFGSFAAAVTAEQPAPAAAEAAPAAPEPVAAEPLPPPPPQPASRRLPPAAWVTGLAVIIILLLYFFTR
jgi:carbon monoxide dehydrogenase subunit G